MRGKNLLLRCLLGLLLVIVTGCAIDYKAVRSIEATLTTVSTPYTNFNGLKVVLLIWKYAQSPTMGTYDEELGEKVGAKYRQWEDLSVEWEAISPEKIPSSLHGTFVNKKIKLSYRIVSMSNPPLVNIIGFEILK